MANCITFRARSVNLSYIPDPLLSIVRPPFDRLESDSCLKTVRSSNSVDNLLLPEPTGILSMQNVFPRYNLPNWHLENHSSDWHENPFFATPSRNPPTIQLGSHLSIQIRNVKKPSLELASPKPQRTTFSDCDEQTNGNAKRETEAGENALTPNPLLLHPPFAKRATSIWRRYLFRPKTKPN